MYTSMLEQAVREQKGDAGPQEFDTQLTLGLNIRIPADYIGEENQRLRMYKCVAGVEDEKALADVTAELGDRYGAPPAAVENLLRYAALRLQSKRIGVAGIDRKRDLVNIRFVADAKIDPQRLADFVAKRRCTRFVPAGILNVT